MRLRVGDTELAMLSTVATFGTPLDVTVAELVIETFFPADEASGRWFRERTSLRWLRRAFRLAVLHRRLA